MKQFNREGRYSEAFEVFAEARGAEADLARRVILGYVSYALNRVGEVAQSAADVDSIMSYGFNWVPPAVIVDLIGAKNIIKLINHYKLTVPPVVEKAASNGDKLYYWHDARIRPHFSRLIRFRSYRYLYTDRRFVYEL